MAFDLFNSKEKESWTEKLKYSFDDKEDPFLPSADLVIRDDFIKKMTVFGIIIPTYACSFIGVSRWVIGKITIEKAAKLIFKGGFYGGLCSFVGSWQAYNIFKMLKRDDDSVLKDRAKKIILDRKNQMFYNTAMFGALNGFILGTSGYALSSLIRSVPYVPAIATFLGVSIAPLVKSVLISHDLTRNEVLYDNNLLDVYINSTKSQYIEYAESPARCRIPYYLLNLIPDSIQFLIPDSVRPNWMYRFLFRDSNQMIGSPHKFLYYPPEQPFTQPFDREEALKNEKLFIERRTKRENRKKIIEAMKEERERELEKLYGEN